MALSSFELVFLTISLLLPGYIIDVILKTRRIRKSEESQIAFFRWLVLGTIAELPWLISGFLIVSPHWETDGEFWRYIVDHRWWFTIWWIATVFAWPFLFGWILAESEAIFLRRRRDGVHLRFAAIVGRMVAAQGPINDDSSWDTKFTRLEQVEGGQWILVELIDGNWVAGHFGRGSDASVDPNERDLYLADVIYTSFERRFDNVGEPDSILIPAGQIRVIHFWEAGNSWQSSESTVPEERLHPAQANTEH